MILQDKQLTTALLITYNEEKNIKAVLENLAFADEIIVVDSFSTDKTIEIASAFTNVKIVQRIFDDFAAQRNFAIGLATHSWIIFIDADERITPELQNEIIATINQKNTLSAYYIYRDFIFEDKRLHFSGWQTDKIIRLFKKEQASYNIEKIVHEKLVVKGQTGKLKHKLIHYSYANYTEYKQKMIFYGKLKAKEELLRNTNPNAFHYYIRPVYQFSNQYLLRLGFLDGKKGIVICYLNALSVAVRFQELKKLRSEN